MLFLLLAAAGLSAVCIPSAAAQQQKAEQASDVYEFGAGDVLDIFVFEEPELSKTVTVRSDGRISLPLIGDVTAAGVTPEELSKKISLKLGRFIEVANVTVILAESRKFYYVLGQVERSGQYSMIQPLTVFQAVARAGGFSEWAKKSRIMVVRGSGKSEKIIYFNYEDFLEGRDSSNNVLVKTGDTIIVP